MPAGSRAAGWWFKLVAGAILTVVVLTGGGYLAARYLFWPNIDRIATHYADSLNDRVGAPLRWASLTTEWTGWRPSLTVNGLRIGEADDASTIERVSATLALRPLLAGQVAFHSVVLDAPQIRLRQDDEAIWLAALGRPAHEADPSSSASQRALGFVGWLLQQPDVRVGGGSVLLEPAAPGPVKPLRFEQVAVVLRNGSGRSDLRVDVGQAGDIAASLALQGEFTHAGAADPAALVDPENWSADIRTEARRLALATIRARLPERYRAAWQEKLPQLDVESVRGLVDPTLTAVLNRGRLQDLRLRWRGDQVSFAVPGQAPVRFARTQADARWQPAVGGGGALSVGQLEVVLDDGARLTAASPTAITLATGADGQPVRATLALETFDMASWLGPVRQLLPGLPGLQQLEVSGKLAGLRLDWAAAQADGPPHLAVRGSFEAASAALASAPLPPSSPVSPPASVKPQPRPPAAATAAAAPPVQWPAIRNLSGRFEATANRGQLTLRRAAGDKTPAAIRFGGVFAEPEIAFDELDAEIVWLIDRAAGPQWLTVWAERFNFSNADGRGSLSGRYLGGSPEHQVIDARGRIDRLAANRVWRYLPVALDASVRQWVRRAFGSGHVEGVEMRWSGPLHAFPYRLKPGAASDTALGQFRIGGKVRDVMLQYAPGWPAVHGIHGDLVFDRASMRFNGERGTIFEVPLARVTARIDDLFNARLELAGQASGDSAQFLKFVTDSPLGATLGEAVAPIDVAGTSALNLDLQVPLQDVGKTTVKGRINWTGGRFAVADSGLRLDEVNGELQFSETALEFERVAARLHGRPVDVSGRVAQPGVMNLTAEGRVDTAVLRGLLGEQPLFTLLRGSTPYRAGVDLADGKLRVQVDSDLVGLVSRLPAPLRKSADVKRPFSLTLEQQQGQAQDRISASLAGAVSLLAERTRSEPRGPLRLSRAAVAVNRQPVMPDQGISLQVTEQRVDLDEWFAVAEQIAGAGTGTGAGATAATAAATAGDAGALLSPLAINVVTDELRVAGRTFSKVLIGASRDDDHWNANIAAREINGYVNWQGTSLAGGRLLARLSRLEIPQSDRDDATGGADPAGLPALDITAERFVFGGVDLGALTLQASNTAARAGAAAGRTTGGRAAATDPAWTIDRLRLVNPGAEFDATGAWQRTTRLDYTLKVIDAGQLLERFQVHKAVKGGSGTLSGRLEWDGSPTSIDRSRLGGELTIAIRDGQFLKVEPGAAKLIGVLNLQAIPKLLSLDFRDIFGEGFTFSEIQGQVRILSGVATTDSLAMRGLQAVVQIKGEADLKAQTQNLRVVVLPELNAGVASLAFAALVNPALGLGTLLAQSVLSEPLSRAFAYEFDVSGPWTDPKVSERRRERFGPPPEE